MAITRFGWGGSDLYVFESALGGIECCGCRLLAEAGQPGSWRTQGPPLTGDADEDDELPREAYDEMIGHVWKHIAAGHRVIGDVVPQLVARRDDAPLELTDEQRADKEAADADILNFMGVEDVAVRAQFGVSTPCEPHPSKQPCECGSGEAAYLCMHEEVG